jgi:hypothetical protein
MQIETLHQFPGDMLRVGTASAIAGDKQLSAVMKALFQRLINSQQVIPLFFKLRMALYGPIKVI